MTNATDLDRLILRSPDALLSALPYLLGFHPVESAVIAWLSDGRLLLTQRLDLPRDPAVTSAWHEAVWSHPGVRAADGLVLVIVTDGPIDADLVDTVRAAAGEHGVTVLDIVRQSGDRWWSLLCAETSCCPPQGRPIDRGVTAEVGAEFAVLGRAPLADRDALVASMAPVPERVAAVVRVRPRTRSGRALERWRDQVLGELVSLTGGGADAEPRPTAAQVARLLDGLADVRVRDTLLWEARAWRADEVALATDGLITLLRCAPPGRCAPVATCVALLCWLSGDGARARVALERAIADDPGYSLAALVAASLRAGLPPTAWREAVAGLTREECRHGAGPGLRQAQASL